MLAHEIMTSPVVTIDPDLAVKDAIRMLDRHDITAMPVVDERGRLVGIVSEADLLRGEVRVDPRGRVSLPAEAGENEADVHHPAVVADVMTHGVVAVHESSDAADIARLMLDTGIKSIPVTRGQRVVGIVSRRDLIRALASTDDRIEEQINDLLAEAGLTGWKASVVDGHVTLSGDGSAREAKLAAILARTVPGVGDVHGAG